MSDYIKREDVIEVFEKCSMEDDKLFLVIVRALVNSIPAVDVAEVKHGKWDRNPIAIVCSECGKAFGLVEVFAHYCPSCGAKMDLEREL